MKTFIALFFFLPLFASGQQDPSITAIYNELVTELHKNDPQIEERKFNNKSLSEIVNFHLLDETQAARFRMEKMPNDAFFLQVHAQSISIGSKSYRGLRNGVFAYLNHIGFRYYFPNENWHYIPKQLQLFQPIDTMATPDFIHRRIWYAYGTGSKKADKDYSFWVKANLMGGESVNAGHAYGGIVQRNRAAFQQNPEFFAQKVEKGAVPGNAKFNVANNKLIELCIRDTYQQIEEYKRKNGLLPYMISMDPSDGGGFSTSAASLKIGGPSEQVFYLANKVAKAVAQKYPGVKIGLYAYNFHSEPPAFDLEPNIVVLIATKMSKSRYRLEELLEMWRKKGIELGIREYYGVMAWDWDMPGRPAGAKLSYVAAIKDYEEKGAKFFSAETNNGWISRGIGHYVAAKMLWDVNTNQEIAISEFYTNLFGKASKYIKLLFDSWQKAEVIPLDGQIYDWLQLLKNAGEAESDNSVHKRIDDIKKYLHYVVLYKQWKVSNTDAHLVDLLSYSYRIQDESLVASYPLFRRIANTAVAGKPGMRYNDPAAIWKKNTGSVGKIEIERNLTSDLSRLNRNERKVNVFIPESFSIKQASSFKTQVADSLGASVRLRNTHKIILYIPEGRNSYKLRILGGLTKGGTHKSVILKLYNYTSDLLAENDNLVMEESIDIGGVSDVSLKGFDPGYYMMIVDDAKSGFSFSASNGIIYGILAGSGGRVSTLSRTDLYFYVDVSKFKVENKGVLTLVSPTGRVINLQKKKGISQIEVNEKEKGIWRIKDQKGEFSLIDVLALVSRVPSVLTNP